MIGTNKKRHGAIEVTDPNLGGASVEVERAFFVDLALGIRRGKDFNTDFRPARKDKWSLAEFGASAGEPGEVGGLDPIGGGYGALGHGPAVGK